MIRRLRHLSLLRGTTPASLMAVGLRASGRGAGSPRLGDEPAGVLIAEGMHMVRGEAAFGRGPMEAILSRLPRLDPLLADGLLALVAAGLSLAQLQGFPAARRSTLNVALVLLRTFRWSSDGGPVHGVRHCRRDCVQGTLQLRGPLSPSSA